MRWAALGLGVALAAAVFPFDGAISGAARGLGSRLGGDVVRELEAVQQFGAFGSLVIVAAFVWALDPGRRRRLLDLAVAAAWSGVVVQALKMAVGRPRPKFGDPGVLLGPFGAYPVAGADPPGVWHAWEAWRGISSDLWSMPSSHTAAAVALAVYLGVVYPRVRPVVVALAAVVGASRVVLGAHYASDVAVGAAVGFACAHAAVTGWWGVRGLDWAWRRAVDRGASPAYPRMRAAEEAERADGAGGGA